MRKRAGFWIRVAALAVDIAVGGLAALIVSGIIRLDVSVTYPRDHSMSNAADAAFAAILLAYFFLDVVWAKTPGKYLLRLEIADADGSCPSRWRLLWRWSTKTCGLHFALALALFPNAGIQFLEQLMRSIVAFGCLAAINDDKRTWHDEWTSTAVFWKARTVATPPPLPTPPSDG